MAFCGKCGSQNDDTVSFCEECGNPMQTGTAAAAPSVDRGVAPGQQGGYAQPQGGYPPSGGYAQPQGGYPPPGGYGGPPLGGYGPVPITPSGTPLPGPLAEWGTRALGYLIDAACTFVVFLPFLVLGAITNSAIFSLLAYAASFGITIWFAVQIGETGQSPGMRVAGVKCVSMNTGGTIGGGLGVGRAFATILNSVICYVGWLFPLWDGMKQTLADKVVSTVVCVVPKRPFNLIPPPTSL